VVQRGRRHLPIKRRPRVLKPNGRCGLAGRHVHFTTIDDPKGPGTTVANGINCRGDVGRRYSDNSGTHGFLRSGGHFTTLDDPNAVGLTLATVINARRQIVGYDSDAGGGGHGFLLSRGQSTTLDDPQGVESTVAQGINNGANNIYGTYVLLK
jgi:hypothetical protein